MSKYAFLHRRRCGLPGRPHAGATEDLRRLAGELEQYHLFHATRGELLRALGRPDDARAADERALELTDNPGERALLERRLATRSR